MVIGEGTSESAFEAGVGGVECALDASEPGEVGAGESKGGQRASREGGQQRGGPSEAGRSESRVHLI